MNPKTVHWKNLILVVVWLSPRAHLCSENFNKQDQIKSTIGQEKEQATD